MNRTLACIAVFLGVLLVAGLMRAQDGVPQTASPPRKLPSSVGRLLTASPEENAARLTFLTKLERPCHGFGGRQTTARVHRQSAGGGGYPPGVR